MTDPRGPSSAPKTDMARLTNWAGMKDFSDADSPVVNEDYARVSNERNGLAREMLALQEERDKALAIAREAQRNAEVVRGYFEERHELEIAGRVHELIVVPLRTRLAQVGGTGIPDDF